MAGTFAYTKIEDATGKRECYGTFTCAGGNTGGDIDTGMNRVSQVQLQVCASSANNAAVVNETISGGSTTGIFTIVCTANDTGFWLAKGI